MEQKDLNVINKKHINFNTFLLVMLFLFWGISCVYCQNKTSNIKKFEEGLYSKLNSSVVFRGYDFESFTICIKVGSKGLIDTTLISLSALPQLRDALNKLKTTFNYRDLIAEIRKKKWHNLNIVVPVFSIYESTSKHKTFTELGSYATDRLEYFSYFDLTSTDEYLSNCIILKPIILVNAEPVR